MCYETKVNREYFIEKKNKNNNNKAGKRKCSYMIFPEGDETDMDEDKMDVVSHKMFLFL